MIAPRCSAPSAVLLLIATATGDSGAHDGTVLREKCEIRRGRRVFVPGREGGGQPGGRPRGY
jgi:hypothetical protein